MSIFAISRARRLPSGEIKAVYLPHGHTGFAGNADIAAITKGDGCPASDLGMFALDQQHEAGDNLFRCHITRQHRIAYFPTPA